MKKIRTLSLVGLTLFLAGCSTGGTSSNTNSTTSAASATTPIDDSTTSSYPNVILQLKATETELEIGKTLDVKAVVSQGKCDFVCSDPSVASMTVAETGNKVTLKGLKEGSVTITATSVVNPNVKATVSISVIKEKPALRTVLENIQKLDSYTLDISSNNVVNGDNEDTAKELVLNNTILYTDPYGTALINDENGNPLYGKSVLSDGKVVYIQEQQNVLNTTSAPLVQANAGLLTKTNFKGAKDKANQAFEVGEFYSFDAINPAWVSDEKSEDNTYVISGEETDTDGKATNIQAAYVEALLWKLADLDSYTAAVESLGEDYYFSLADQIDTTITVVNSNSISVDVEYGNDIFTITMNDINNTSLDDSLVDIDSTFAASSKASSPKIADSLEKGIAAIKTNNYVQVNSMFPDHKTELKFNTYYTPNYVFYDCNASFKEEYNTHLSTDTTKWDKAPYGYVKKSDGIYKFEYNETANTISLATEKEANTDASTSLVEFEKYFSTISTFNSDLKYAFGQTQEKIWSNHTTQYYMTTSRAIFNDFINYYAPEDIADVIENTKAGLGVTIDASGNVATVNGTLGYTPFDGSDNNITQHTYGVDYFELNSFGSATTNKVHALLGF